MPDFIRADKKKLNCDQVSMLMSILERLLSVSNTFTRFDRISESVQLAALLEIMDTLGYEFEDTKASGNALSRFSEFNELRGLN